MIKIKAARNQQAYPETMDTSFMSTPRSGEDELECRPKSDNGRTPKPNLTAGQVNSLALLVIQRMLAENRERKHRDAQLDNLL